MILIEAEICVFLPCFSECLKKNGKINGNRIVYLSIFIYFAKPAYFVHSSRVTCLARYDCLKFCSDECYMNGGRYHYYCSNVIFGDATSATPLGSPMHLHFPPFPWSHGMLDCCRRRHRRRSRASLLSIVSFFR